MSRTQLPPRMEPEELPEQQESFVPCEQEFPDPGLGRAVAARTMERVAMMDVNCILAECLEDEKS